MEIRRKTTTTQVVDILRARIFSGALQEGTQLRQEHLATELGVSRVPIREALHQLEAEGLVTMHTHRGALVSSLSLDELTEVYEIRARLEPWLLELSLPHIDDADFEEAELLLTKLADEKNNQHWTALNWDFHAAIYRQARRPHTVELLRKLYLNAYRHFPPSIRFAGGHAHMHAEHRTLLDLCRQRDITRAKAHLEDHILIGSRNLIARLRAERAEADRSFAASA